MGKMIFPETLYYSGDITSCSFDHITDTQDSRSIKVHLHKLRCSHSQQVYAYIWTMIILLTRRGDDRSF